MTTFYLVRHGANDSVGNGLAGRRAGVPLNTLGRAQADWAAERLAKEAIEAVYSSPMERTRETAEAISRRTGAALQLEEQLNEVDFGEWTGLAFNDLARDPRWEHFNQRRSLTRAPGGELMLEVQARMVTALDRLKERHPKGRIAVVSHGDPVRSVLAYYAGIPIDLMQRFEIDLASISVLVMEGGGALIRCINHRGGLLG